MYATTPLSLFKSHPEAAARLPPEGRNSGYLVVKGDEDGDDDQTCCWGQCAEKRVWDLPFPQDRVLTLTYTERHKESSKTYDYDDRYGGSRNTYTERYRESSTTYTDSVVFVPVPDQPLASNRYYAVVATGKRKGLVRTCSGEDDMTPCCFFRCINDVKPRPFHPADVYQQIEIVQRRRGQFTAKAVATDGFPQFLYRKKYWRVYASKAKKHFDLGEALGINAALRSRQLGDSSLLDALPTDATPTAVGKWYCPFYLVKEDGVSPSEQMERGAFYEVALEQRWEPVGDDIRGGSKMYSTRVLVGGSVEARQVVSSGAERHGDGYVWFRAAATGQSVGVCTSVWERMKWEEYRGGWVDEEEETGKVAGRSVLVERFVVKRMDESVVVAFDFVHLNKVRGKHA